MVDIDRLENRSFFRFGSPIYNKLTHLWMILDINDVKPITHFPLYHLYSEWSPFCCGRSSNDSDELANDVCEELLKDILVQTGGAHMHDASSRKGRSRLGEELEDLNLPPEDKFLVIVSEQLIRNNLTISDWTSCKLSTEHDYWSGDCGLRLYTHNRNLHFSFRQCAMFLLALFQGELCSHSRQIKIHAVESAHYARQRLFLPLSSTSSSHTSGAMLSLLVILSSPFKKSKF